MAGFGYRLEGNVMRGCVLLVSALSNEQKYTVNLTADYVFYGGLWGARVIDLIRWGGVMIEGAGRGLDLGGSKRNLKLRGKKKEDNKEGKYPPSIMLSSK